MRPRFHADSNDSALYRSSRALAAKFAPYSQARLAVFCQYTLLRRADLCQNERLDATDRKILELLQADGRMSLAELAEKVGLSPSPCLRRVRMLERTA